MNRLIDMATGVFLASLVVGTALFFLPASLWFEVRSVQVLNTVEGTSPRMIVDRSVNQPFRGDWVVTVLRVIDGGGFEPVCTAPGFADYDPENRYPPNLDLDWWTFPTKCDLEVGEYVVRTIWTIHAYPGIDKTVKSVSPVFTVSPLGDSNDINS